MKIFLSLLIVTVLLSGFNMQTKKEIIFFGDSITQQGVEPNGYIKKLDSILAQKGLDKNYELIGAGVGGNKIYDLYLQIDNDVLAKNPDAVVIWIGLMMCGTKEVLEPEQILINSKCFTMPLSKN